MNGLDDLRHTLDTHAGSLPAADTAARRTSVHHRIRVVRRRRRTGAAAGTLAVVATVAGLVALPGGGDDAAPAPATPVVFGIDLPSSMESLGFTYDYAEHVAGQDGRARLRLPESDEPRLVTWGTSGDDDAVRLRSHDGDTGLVRNASDFDDWIIVGAGEDLDVTATVKQGRPAIAVYTLAAERPPGVTDAGLTFRQDVAGGALLVGRVGAPGEADLTLDATATGPGVRLDYSCTGLQGDGLTLHLATASAGGESNTGIDCSGALPADGTAAGSVAFASEAGEDVSTRFWLTRGPDGPVVDDPDVRLAVAIYARERDPIEGVETLVERDGHTWRLVPEATVTKPDGPTVTLRVPGRGGVALVRGTVSTTRASGGVVDSDFGGRTTSNELSRGSGPVLADLVPAGRTATLTVTDGDAADYEMALRLYVRAD